MYLALTLTIDGVLSSIKGKENHTFVRGKFLRPHPLPALRPLFILVCALLSSHRGVVFHCKKCLYNGVEVTMAKILETPVYVLAPLMLSFYSHIFSISYVPV